MWFCWLHHTMTLHIQWGSLQLSVKRSGETAESQHHQVWGHGSLPEDNCSLKLPAFCVVYLGSSLSPVITIGEAGIRKCSPFFLMTERLIYYGSNWRLILVHGKTQTVKVVKARSIQEWGQGQSIKAKLLYSEELQHQFSANDSGLITNYKVCWWCSKHGPPLQPPAPGLLKNLCQDPVCWLQFCVQYHHPGSSTALALPAECALLDLQVDHWLSV